MEIINEFAIEKNIPCSNTGRGKPKNPLYLPVKATMEKMDVKDSFSIPLNGYKMLSIRSMIAEIEKTMNSKILDENIRKKNGWKFTNSVTKNDAGIEVFMRVWRIQ